MERRHFMWKCCMAAAGVALVGPGAALSQDRNRARLRDPIRDEDIYGTQFMSQQERERYREQRRAARNDDERQRLQPYHNRMHMRARNKGVTLPGDPRGRNGMGGGAGNGAGNGGGRQGG